MKIYDQKRNILHETPHKTLKGTINYLVRKNADLHGADLRWADLREAKFSIKN